MKTGLLLAAVYMGATLAHAQVFPDPPDPAGPTILTQGQLPPPDVYMREGMQNYTNAFVSLSGIYDSNLPYSPSGGQGAAVRDSGGWGGQIGAGFNVYHRIQHGLLWVNYTGSYARYSRPEFRNATNQNFAVAYSKMLSARWTIRASESVLFYQNLGSTFLVIPSAGFFPSTQPYSQKSFFNSSTVTLGYQWSHRLSLFFGGDFFSSVYRPSVMGGYTGVSGNAGASYRFSRRTSLTATYALSHLGYSGGGLSSNIQTGSLTLSYMLTRRMELGLSAGVSRVSSSGTASIYFQGVPDSSFFRGTYKQETLAPNFSGSLFRTGRRSRYGVAGGQNISGGKGIYLTSKNLFVNGSANYQINPRLSLSGLVGYNRLSSVANAASTYQATTYNVTAGYQVSRHTFVNFAYSGWRFPNYGTIRNFNAHRLSVGVTFATRDYPLPY